MSLSGIAQVVRGSFVRSLSSFVADGKLHLLWATANAHNNVRHLYWRPHDAAEGTEIEAAFACPYSQVVAVVRSDGALLVLYTDGDATVATIYAIALDRATGAVVMPAVFVARGGSPSITTLEGVSAGRHALVYARRDEGAIYVGETLDDGLTWEVGRAVLNNAVVATESVRVVGFNREHFSIVQAAKDARLLREVGSLTRSRPVSAIAASPDDGRYFVTESANRGAALTDSLRGSICAHADHIEVLTRTRVGTADGVGDLALVDVSSGTPAVVSSWTVPTGASAGAGAVKYDLPAVAPGAALEGFLGASVCAADLVCIEGGDHLYVAGYREGAFDGALAAVRMADGVFTTPLTNARVYAVALGQRAPFSESVLAAAYETAAGYRLAVGRAGSAGGDLLAPRWNEGVHKLPGRVNKLAVALDGAQSGLIYAGLADRLNVYRLDGLSRPVRLIDSIPVLTRGRIFQILPLASGNLVVAAGEAGVAVLTPSGETLGQIVPSTLAVPYWKQKAWSVNDLCQPTAESNYTAQRRYFRCTQAGTSAVAEPPWGPTGTIVDGGARWTEVGDIQPVVTGVAVDNTRKRIVAVGALGGIAGTSGRVWVLDAAGLV